MSTHPRDHDDADTLFWAVFDGQLGGGDFDALQQRMREDPELVRSYLRYAELNAELTVRGGLVIPIQSAAIATGRIPGWIRTPAKRLVAGFALAAAVLIVAMVWSFSPDDHMKPHVAAPVTTPRVAMLSDMSEDAVFTDSPARMALGSELPPGSIRLAAGAAQVMFDSTAVVDLYGPCEFNMLGVNRGVLRRGRIQAYVPQRASGFAVDLPGGARVVDRGTRFDAIVDANGDSEVRVLDGLVELTHQGQRLLLSSHGGGVINGRLVRIERPLVNGDFESGAAPLLGWPVSIGQWGGEPVRIVGAEQGVTPSEGRRMMRFMYAAMGGASKAAGSQLYQFVDLRPYAAAIAQGRVTVELSARFNRVNRDERTDRRFLLALYPHRELIGNFQPPQRHPADSTARLTSDADPATWQPLRVTLTPTPGDDYAIAALSAMEDAYNDLSGEEFHGHYVDAVELRVIIEFPESPESPTREQGV